MSHVIHAVFDDMEVQRQRRKLNSALLGRLIV